MGKQGWREFKYKYENPGFLRFLVNILSGQGVQASVLLWPNEILGELEKERSRFRDMDEEDTLKSLEAYGEFLKKLKNLGIIPGWYLSFDNESRQNNEPEIKKLQHYRNSNRFGTVYDEPYATLVHPANFLGKKWESVSLHNFLGEESIRRLKEAVASFSENGYTLVRVNANLNPRYYTSDHYYDGVDYDGHLSAGEGTLVMYGSFPEDFDFSKLIPKKLTEEKKMLEQLVKTA